MKRLSHLNWVEVNENESGTYTIAFHVNFEFTILKLILCLYNDAYILTKETLTVAGNTAGTQDSINK